MARTEKLPHVPSTSLRDVPPRDARECVTKCRPKRDGHTHSRLSVICIIKEKKKEKEGEKRESEKERERKKKQDYIVRIYSYGLYRYLEAVINIY